MNSNYIPDRAMFIFAHPDDIEFGSAGTAAKWAKNGSDVLYVVLTDGNIGSREEGMTAEKLAEIRRREQTEAAEVAGARVIYMGEPDGRLQPTLALRKKLVRLIRQQKPNVVVCGDPQFFYSDTYINHPDHRNAGQVALEAVFPSADSPLLFPELNDEEGVDLWKVNYVYVSFGRRDANLYIDISETIDTKIEALRKHVSQLGDWNPDERMREWAAENGRKVGYPYAEAYYCITLKPVEEETSE